MVTCRLAEETRPVLDCPTFFVTCAEVKPPDPCKGNGRGAHRAGFERDIEVAVRKALASKQGASLADDKDLCMGRRIIQFQCPVAVARDELAISDNHGADRHFAAQRCRFGFGERGFHVSVSGS